MTSGHVFIATSLDGFISREDGSIDWLPDPSGEHEDYGYGPFMASMDGLVIGRGTYEKVLTFGAWPYSKPVIVMSQSLSASDVPDGLADRIELSAEAPADLMDRLSQRGWKRAYVDGGQLIQSFLRDSLIETLTITRIPVLIGKGRPLFGVVPADILLEHLETRTYPSGLVSSTYRVIRD